MSKLRPETIKAVAATYARILEREYPGLLWDVRPLKAGEGDAATTLRHSQGQIITFDHDGSFFNRQPATSDEHGIESAADDLALDYDIKVKQVNSVDAKRRAA